jgi:hypothetical protein
MNKEEKEEEYIHFVSCIEDLNRAWNLANQIAKESSNPLLSAAWQFALIEYSKPYLNSFGKIRRYKLSEECIPEAYRDLHRRIVSLRSQLLAHSDLTIKDARLYVSKHPLGDFSGIVQNTLDRNEGLTNIEKIVRLIEGTLQNMYEKEKALLAGLDSDE